MKISRPHVPRSHSERQRRISILFVGQNNQKQNRLSALASHVDYEMAEFVDLHFVAGIEQDRRAQLFNHRGAIESITGLEPATKIDRTINGLPTAVEDHRPFATFILVTVLIRRGKRQPIFESSKG